MLGVYATNEDRAGKDYGDEAVWVPGVHVRGRKVSENGRCVGVRALGHGEGEGAGRADVSGCYGGRNGDVYEAWVGGCWGADFVSFYDVVA